MGPSVRYIRSSVQEMLAHLKTNGSKIARKWVKFRHASTMGEGHLSHRRRTWDPMGPHNIFFRKKITNLNPVTPDLMLSELIHYGQSQRKPWISNNYLPRHCHWLGRPGLPTTGRGWPRNLCPGHTFVPCLLSPPRVSRTLGEYDLARCQQNKVHQDQGSEYSIAYAA